MPTGSEAPAPSQICYTVCLESYNHPFRKGPFPFTPLILETWKLRSRKLKWPCSRWLDQKEAHSNPDLSDSKLEYSFYCAGWFSLHHSSILLDKSHHCLHGGSAHNCPILTVPTHWTVLDELYLQLNHQELTLQIALPRRVTLLSPGAAPRDSALDNSETYVSCHSFSTSHRLFLVSYLLNIYWALTICQDIIRKKDVKLLGRQMTYHKITTRYGKCSMFTKGKHWFCHLFSHSLMPSMTTYWVPMMC